MQRRQMHLLWLACLLLTAIRALTADTELVAAERLQYRETTGAGSTVKNYTFVKTATGYALRLSQGGIVQEMLCDGAYQTVTERYIRQAGGDNITARREAGRLVFTGSAGGRPVSSQTAIGSDLWYGSKLLLRGFVLSQQQSEDFYMTSPEEQKAVKLRAEKQAVEDITVCGSRFRAVKIKCTLPDYPLLPWKSYFWYRASDGILLRSEERRGPPWEPLTVVELAQEEPQAAAPGMATMH